MKAFAISDRIKQELKEFLNNQSSPDLGVTYLFFLEKKFDLDPVLLPKAKKIFRSEEDAIRFLEETNDLWKETEIKVGYSSRSVDEKTKKIYICPFSGKVFGDNTHPSPQDAIYDWVSKCPENKETVGGLKVKRFYVSDDPEVIKEYMLKSPVKEPVAKVVYSSVFNGKLFNSKEAVIKDFKKNYLKPMTLIEVQNQNRFEIEEGFLSFLQEQLDEQKITAFVEALAEEDEFVPYVKHWVEGE